MIRKKIAVVVGTRPNFVKCTCVLKELEKNRDFFDYYLIDTGQHYDYSMAGVFFQELEIKAPDMHLDPAKTFVLFNFIASWRRIAVMRNYHEKRIS